MSTVTLNLGLPEVATPEQIAPVVGKSPAALAQDRNRGRGIPYVKLGCRIRYLRADVEEYLISNRVSTGTPAGAA